MKKKSIKVQRKASHTSPHAAIKLHYIVVFFGIVLLVLGTTKMYQKPHVLGASVLLAQGGDDSGGSSGHGGDSGSSGGGGSNSGGGNTSGSGSGGSSGSGGGDHSGSSGSGGGSAVSQNVVPDNTKVDCVGPDGKHFTTEFKDCSELNNAWHRSNFSFTPLSPSTTNTIKESEKEPAESGKTEHETEKNKTSESDKLEVKIEGNNKNLKLNKEGTKVELEVEDGKVVVKAKTEDGTETELETKDALDKLNDSLSEQDVEVGTDEAKGLLIRKGEVEAHTQFPLSVDPITHELTITTPAGVKTVTVLPDQAVQNLLSSKVLTNIENTTQTSASGTATMQSVTLTTQNNEPVFTVNGTSNKKVFGLLPISFAKQITVSAETGKVLQTNEVLISRILEALSF